MQNMLPRDIRTKPVGVLAASTRPADARLPEAMPYVFFDTQTYPAAGIAHLDFFQAVQGDKTLGNVEVAGTLASPQFFDIWSVKLDFLSTPSATVADTAAGIVNDAELILKAARATWTLTLASKRLGPIPATFLGASGIIRAGFDTGRAAAAGAIIQQFGGIDNGGYPINGAITLPPAQNFGFGMDFVAGQAVSGNTLLRVSLHGVLYRKVG